MTAPSLVLLGFGSGHPRSAEVSHALAQTLLASRPGLDVHIGYLDHNPPTGLQVARTLARQGVEEAVFVPLVMSEVFDDPRVESLIGQIRAGYPKLTVAASRPIGPDAALLSVLDRRLRDALRSARVHELDALVFAAAGSNDVRSTSLIARRARQWAHHHKLPFLTSYATGSGPSTGEAVRTLRSQGRRHIAVGSWFAAPGHSYRASCEQGFEAGAVAVSAPLGAQTEMAEAALNRYVVAAMDLVDLEPMIGEVEVVPERHLSIVSA